MRLELEQRSIADQESALDDISANLPAKSATDTGFGPLKLFSSDVPHGEPRPIRWRTGIGGLIAGSVVNAVIERFIAMIWGS